MNFVFFGPATIGPEVGFRSEWAQGAGVRIPQVIEKKVPMELVLKDLSVSELFMKDKMARVSTHALLRGLSLSLSLFPRRP